MIHFVRREQLEARTKHRPDDYLTALKKIVVLETEAGLFCDDLHPDFPRIFEKYRGFAPSSGPPPKAAPGEKPILLILGIHRTLSSCLAVCLQELGFYLGKTNAGGEDLHLAKACETFLPFGTTRIRGEKDKRHEVFLRILRRIADESGDSPIAVKYPLLCGFADDIAEIWPNLRFLSLVRPFEHSVQSLIDRTVRRSVNDQFYTSADACTAHQRFLDHRKTEFLRDRDCLQVAVEDELLKDPADCIGRVAATCGLRYSDDQMQNAIAHVKPYLSSHSKSREVIPGDWESEVTILIKTFARKAHCRRLVDSIRRYYKDLAILVLDDSPEPMTVLDGAEVLPWPEELGLSAGRNNLVELAKTPFVFLCDDDMIFSEDTRIDILLEQLKSKDMDILATVVDKPHTDHQIAGKTLRLSNRILFADPHAKEGDDQVGFFDFVPNAFLAKRESLRRCRFDDRLMVGEHADFAIKCWRRKLRIGQSWSCHIVDDCRGDSAVYIKHRRRSTQFRRESLAIWSRRLGFNCFRAGQPSTWLSRLDTDSLPTIPNVIHQLWFGSDLIPPEYINFSLAWQKINPSWAYRLWTDEEELLSILWPTLRGLYDRARFVNKTDLMRIMVLYRFGGWYFDIDFEPLRPLSALSDLGTAMLCRQTDRHIGTAMLAGIERHEFFGEFLRRADESYRPRDVLSLAAHYVTQLAKNRSDVVIRPREDFFPVSWKDRHLLKERNFGDAFAVHHYAKTWGERKKDPEREEIPRYLTCPSRSRQLSTVVGETCGSRGEVLGLFRCTSRGGWCVLRPCRKDERDFLVCSKCPDLPGRVAAQSSQKT